ncbi:hypothetical protein ACH5RR_018110 [Cinchona calisaya]|uniref:non-specific serine/threonine protein kinase n=1 Tax=Cinchona calisaya TaxID=153742 RepID=A0ABD2ZKM5_9GENT
MLRDGKIFAIKVFNLEFEGPFKSFGTECEVLCKLHHRNPVKVISCCSNPDVKAIILEYMPNESLEKWLHSHNYFLNFVQRLDIMTDVAVALGYLHHGYSSPVVHCDLKPSNVLLGEEMTSHLSDFGIAKLFHSDESMRQTKTLATIGYIAPEYGSEGIVSTRCDVYSFGILLMETFSRKKPTDEMFSEDWRLKDWVADLLQNSTTYFIDNGLTTICDQNPARLVKCTSKIMELALTCTVDSFEERIDIKDVLEELKRIKLYYISK